MKLKIANEHGNFDTVFKKVPRGYVLVRGHQLSVLCRKHQIACVPAVTDWNKRWRKYPAKPVIGGVIVTRKRHPALVRAIEEYHSPEATQKRLKQAARRETRKNEWTEKYGFHDFHQPLAIALRAGRVDKETAELLAFKAKYRHEFSDYDERYQQLDWEQLREDFGFVGAKEYSREYARNFTEQPIPATWLEYLEKYDFNSPEAVALSNVLQDPQRAHPVWFKKAEIAVRGLKLEELTYEAITRAIRQCFETERAIE